MTRVIKVLGFLALMVVASSFVYADTFSCAGANATVSTICGNTTLGLAGNRTAFDTQAGNPNYDAINWASPDGINDGTSPPCSGTYCYMPDYYPFGSGTTGGTNFSLGMGAEYTVGPPNPQAGTSLYTTGTFLGLPSGANTILSNGTYGDPTVDGQQTFYGGDADGMLNYGMTFDTSDTSPAVSGVYGVGFDFQMGVRNGVGGTVAATGYSVTFEVFAPTTGCNYTTDNAANAEFVGGSIDNNAIVNCFDYQTGQTTSAGSVSESDGNTYLSGAVDNGAGSGALLATITISSSNGSAGFFSLTSSTPIGAIYEVTANADGGEGNGAFGIDQVDLLTQESTATPEPATLLLFGSGLLFAARRLRKSVAK